MIRLHYGAIAYGRFLDAEVWPSTKEQPSEIDATAYGFLAHILWAPGSRRTREHLQQTRNLPAFCERMKQTYYGGHAS
jgi:hypothetical protein